MVMQKCNPLQKNRLPCIANSPHNQFIGMRCAVEISLQLKLKIVWKAWCHMSSNKISILQNRQDRHVTAVHLLSFWSASVVHFFFRPFRIAVMWIPAIVSQSTLSRLVPLACELLQVNLLAQRKWQLEYLSLYKKMVFRQIFELVYSQGLVHFSVCICVTIVCTCNSLAKIKKM